MSEEILAAMRDSIVNGLPESAAELARQALALEMDPLEAIERGFVPGITAVGGQFACGQMFLPDLMASSEAMKAAMAVLEPALKAAGTERPTMGTVVLGTTRGDIHEIGKALVGTLLTANGFQVHDLGTNVSSEAFVSKAREVKADIVGISALLTTTMAGQKTVLEALDRAGLRKTVKIMVGGAPVTQRWADEIGADGYGKDAMSAVILARKLVEQ
jgi:corrinoid protein of di/trimethylamine methyltransferase